MDHLSNRSGGGPAKRPNVVELVKAETANGVLHGLRTNGAVAFRGIPYAADTGGRNRFMAPQPVENWSVGRAAFQSGDRCLQPKMVRTGRDWFAWYERDSSFSENCCVLNVFSPDLNRDARRPVMVYFHGGGFASGGGGGPALDGTNLAAFGDVVVVSVNHRLNLLGFLSLEFLHPDFADAGNAGMLDILAALRWVKTNIEAFGGDPGNVTVFGQSGGGAKVLTLLGMPGAQDLFARGIDMSGSSALKMTTSEAREPVALEMLRHLGLGRGDVHKLQDLPYAAILAAHEAATKRIGTPIDYRPVIDGRHIHEAPFSETCLRKHGSKPLMLGTTNTESTFWLGVDPSAVGITEHELLARFKAQYGLDDRQALALAAAYRTDDPTLTPYGLLARISTDALFRGTLLRYAEAKAKAGPAPVYVYDFAWRVPAEGGKWISPHCVDIPFVFGNLCLASAMTDGDAAAESLSDAVMSAYVSFARTGNPENALLPHWPPYDGARRATMVFKANSEAMDDHMGASRIAHEDLGELEHFDLLPGPLFCGVGKRP